MRKCPISVVLVPLRASSRGGVGEW